MDSPVAQEALQRQFVASILLEPIVQPLEDAMGEYGALAAQSFAQTIAATMERT